jgi:hypothetical protein
VANADAKSTYEIELKDSTSGPAAKAANALKDLRSQIDGDTAALAKMQAAMKRLQSAAVVDIATHRSLAKAIQDKKNAIAQSEAAYLSLGGTFEKVASKGKGTSSLIERLTEAAKGTPGPLSGLVSRLGGLRGLLVGGIMVAGIAAVAAALIAVTAAALGAAAALLKYGIASADARRNELLHLEGLTKLRNWYGLAAGNAKEMQGAIDAVAGSTPLAREQLAKMTDQLYRMGLRGENLAQALEGAAIKTSAQGDAAGNAFMGWAAGAAIAGGSVKKLTDDVKARMGGVVAKQMLSLTTQTKKLSENFDALFNGLALDAFLRGLSMVTSLLSQSTETGKALKSMFTALFQPVLDGAETAGLYVKRFFQGVTIGALMLTVGLLKVRNWFKRTFGDSEILKGFDLQKAAVYAGLFAVNAFAATLGLAAAATVTLVAGLAVLTSPLTLLIGLVLATKKAFDFIQDTDWKALGMSVAQGIAAGITKGATWVLDSIRGLAAKATTAFKSALGIASPSKAFAKLGATLPQGVQVGVEQGTPGAQGAVDSMISIPEAGGQGGARAAGGPTVYLTIEHLTVNAASDAAAVIEGIKTKLVSEFQLAMVQLAVPTGV